MKKTFAVLIGIAVGAALTAAITYSKRGKEVRTNLVKKADELRQSLADNVKDKTRNIQDSEFTYI
jgi:gas vesicle protein